MPSAGEDVEQLDLSGIADRNVKQHRNSGKKSVAVSYTVKHALTIGPPAYLYQRNENVCPYKNQYMNIHSSFIRNSPKQKQPKFLSIDK